jgi:hypothetical protein
VDPYTYTFDISGIKDGTGLLNIDGRLRLEMRYYAFGDIDSGSSGWNIRNGLDFDEDNGGSGGELVVQFGSGSVIPQTVDIEMNL